MKLSKFLVLFAVVSMVQSCSKTEVTDIQKNIRDLNISPSFDFSTSRQVDVEVILSDNTGHPVPFGVVEIFDGLGSPSESSDEDRGTRLFRGATNSQGKLQVAIAAATSLEELIISPSMPGFPRTNKVPIVDGKAKIQLGGASRNTKSTEIPTNLKSASNTAFNVLGTWNSVGVPNYLTQPGDAITASFLADLNASLPEQTPLTTSHPEYLESTAEGNLVLIDSCSVWITFVHEGAGWKNALGFYTYPENDPPETAQDITNRTIIFPNSSFNGSGGGLYSGDKVYIGDFGAGTVIGWFLVANGWSTSSSTVTNGTHIVYSNVLLNPEPNAALKKHQVLLNDAITGRMIIAFEDMRRDQGADNDFNDAVFFATANPIEAVQTNNIRYLDSPNDGDNDGVPDAADAYPTDPTRAFNSFYPSEEGFATLAFEDLWPGQGDYDFNDLVLSYRIQQVTNALNEVVEMFSSYQVKAIGASYHNGFGIELNIPPSAVSSVTGGNFSQGIVTRNPNGTEASQAKAVIIAFEDAFDMLPFPGQGTGVNTNPAGPYVVPELFTQHILFSSPVSISTLGLPPFNPFIFIQGDRGREVHLPDQAPTSLANLLLLGTNSDDSNPAAGRYYRSDNHLPWAINISSDWEHPIEKAPINEAYLKFNPWAESAGVSFPAWHSTPNSEYRLNSLIYQP